MDSFPIVWLLTLAIIIPTNAEFSTQECRELGFIKTQLMCSSCNDLTNFGLGDLQEHCIECCQKDDIVPTTRRYPKAVLEVCTCKFGAYPQIQAFIKSDRPAKFPNLQIRYLRGLDPIVKLYDENDNVVEVLSITKWNTDAVEEFFATHLMKQDDSENDYLKTNRI